VHVSLLLIGLAKVVFGIVTGAIGIFFASRLLRRLMRRGSEPASSCSPR
jgi:hypothetical protein